MLVTHLVVVLYISLAFSALDRLSKSEALYQKKKSPKKKNENEYLKTRKDQEFETR